MRCLINADKWQLNQVVRHGLAFTLQQSGTLRAERSPHQCIEFRQEFGRGHVGNALQGDDRGQGRQVLPSLPPQISLCAS